MILFFTGVVIGAVGGAVIAFYGLKRILRESAQ